MIAILAAALAVAPGPYAEAYCRLRQAGWSEAAAFRAATYVSLRPGNPDPAGSGLRLDILEAQAAALARCPDL